MVKVAHTVFREQRWGGKRNKKEPTAFWKTILKTTLQFFKSNQNSHLLHRGNFLNRNMFLCATYEEEYIYTGSKKNEQKRRSSLIAHCYMTAFEAVTFLKDMSCILQPGPCFFISWHLFILNCSRAIYQPAKMAILPTLGLFQCIVNGLKLNEISKCKVRQCWFTHFNSMEMWKSHYPLCLTWSDSMLWFQYRYIDMAMKQAYCGKNLVILACPL